MLLLMSGMPGAEGRLLFQVEANGAIEMINKKKRTLGDFVIQGDKARKERKFDIFQSINGVNN